MHPVRHLFWDFDGTLYDSYPQLLNSVMMGLKEVGHGTDFAPEEVLRLIKVNVVHGMRVCAERLAIPFEELFAAYQIHHRSEGHFIPYDGLKDCLVSLHEAGFRHYLYTHRDLGAVVQLKQDGLWELFSDAVTKEDGFASKPAPDALLALMERNHLSPQECAMVGDRDIDIDAGHNAGMSGFLFDPEGFYAGYPSELQAVSMAELAQKLLK